MGRVNPIQNIFGLLEFFILTKPHIRPHPPLCTCREKSRLPRYTVAPHYGTWVIKASDVIVKYYYLGNLDTCGGSIQTNMLWNVCRLLHHVSVELFAFLLLTYGQCI